MCLMKDITFEIMLSRFLSFDSIPSKELRPEVFVANCVLYPRNSFFKEGLTVSYKIYKYN